MSGRHRLYGDLAEWMSVLRPAEELAEDAALVFELLGRPGSLLELGCGTGALASHLPGDVVLLDRSPSMLAIARRCNPGRRHELQDLRTARLGRGFDAVLLHDAVMYMLTPGDLAAALATAAAHLHPGGRLLLMPDLVAEDFVEQTLVGAGERGDQAAVLTEWHWDPDPSDDRFSVEFSYLLRDGGTVRAVHESHEQSLRPAAAYVEALLAAGLQPLSADPLLSAQLPSAVFLAMRPEGLADLPPS